MDTTETQSTGGQVREEVAHVADRAREEAGRVADEAKHQGRELYQEATTRAREEAQEQTTRAADGLRSFSRELRSMAEGDADSQSSAVSWVRQGADRIESFADHVDRRGFDGLMDDVSGFARRNPGMFLAISFGTGVVAARVIRNMNGDNGHDRAPGLSASTTSQRHSLPAADTAQPGEAAGGPRPEDSTREAY